MEVRLLILFYIHDGITSLSFNFQVGHDFQFRHDCDLKFILVAIIIISIF